MKTPFGKRFNRFINKRVPRNARMTLNHSRLFILPTKFGYALLVLTALLFVLGTNYQNNPILIISYLMLGWFATAMIWCFNNLNGASLSIVELPDGTVNQPIRITIKLKAKTARFQWRLQVQQPLPTPLPTTEHNSPQPSSFIPEVRPNNTLPADYVPRIRGNHVLPNIRLDSQFPFGIFQCWTYLRFANQHWVYPTPIAEPLLNIAPDVNDLQLFEQIVEQDVLTQKAEDMADFQQLRTYKVGEPISRVSWKHQAKKPLGDWLVKDFAQPQATQQLLTLAHVASHQLEHKLSVLSQACINLTEQDVEFGLILNDARWGQVVVPINKGVEHLRQCQQALANYGLTL